MKKTCSWATTVIGNSWRLEFQYVCFLLPFPFVSPWASHLPCVYSGEQWCILARGMCVRCEKCDFTLYNFVFPRGRKNDEEVLGW